MSRRIGSLFWQCNLACVGWPWRNFHLVSDDVCNAKANLSSWLAGVGLNCSNCSNVKIDGSSRKENRTKSRVCKFVTGSSVFSACSSKLLSVAQFLGRSILPIGVVCSWPCRRQQITPGEQTDHARL